VLQFYKFMMLSWHVVAFFHTETCLEELSPFMRLIYGMANSVREIIVSLTLNSWHVKCFRNSVIV